MCTSKYWQPPTGLNMLTKYILCTIIFFASLPGYTQTEFDSVKRNSKLDTLYQPSSKPTFVTEFAEGKISGFI